MRNIHVWMLAVLTLLCGCSDNRQEFIEYVSDPQHKFTQEFALKTGDTFQVKCKPAGEIALRELLNGVIDEANFTAREDELSKMTHFELSFPSSSGPQDLKGFLDGELFSALLLKNGEKEEHPLFLHVEDNPLSGRYTVLVNFSAVSDMEKELVIHDNSFISATHIHFDLTNLPQLTIK